MAIQDISSDLKTVCAQTATISTNTTTNGSSIDTADYEMGLMFLFFLPSRTDGSYQLNLQESADGSTWADIPSTKLIGSEGALTAALAAAGTVSKVGVFSNLQYVRSQIVSTSVTTGATAMVLAVQKGELMPV
jgi:hypothetical protein